MKWGIYTVLVGGFKHFYFYSYLGRWSNLTNIFDMGWNHQLVYISWNSQFAPLKSSIPNGHFIFQPCEFQGLYALLLTFSDTTWSTKSPEVFTWNLKSESVAREIPCGSYLGGLEFIYLSDSKLGGGFIFYFHLENWRWFSIWRAYLSNGLVQPPTS